MTIDYGSDRDGADDSAVIRAAGTGAGKAKGCCIITRPFGEDRHAGVTEDECRTRAQGAPWKWDEGPC